MTPPETCEEYQICREKRRSLTIGHRRSGIQREQSRILAPSSERLTGIPRPVLAKGRGLRVISGRRLEASELRTQAPQRRLSGGHAPVKKKARHITNVGIRTKTRLRDTAGPARLT